MRFGVVVGLVSGVVSLAAVPAHAQAPAAPANLAQPPAALGVATPITRHGFRAALPVQAGLQLHFYF